MMERAHNTIKTIIQVSCLVIAASVVTGLVVWHLARLPKTVKSSASDGNLLEQRLLTRMRALPVLVPKSTLSGERWQLGVVGSEQLGAILAATANLNEGPADVRRLCEAIEHVADRPIVWLPPLERSDESLLSSVSFHVCARKAIAEPAAKSAQEEGRKLVPSDPSLAELLETVLTHIADAGPPSAATLYKAYGDPWEHDDWPTEELTWVTLVSDERIVFVLLPAKSHPSERRRGMPKEQ